MEVIKIIDSEEINLYRHPGGYKFDFELETHHTSKLMTGDIGFIKDSQTDGLFFEAVLDSTFAYKLRASGAGSKAAIVTDVFGLVWESGKLGSKLGVKTGGAGQDPEIQTVFFPQKTFNRIFISGLYGRSLRLFMGSALNYDINLDIGYNMPLSPAVTANETLCLTVSGSINQQVVIALKGMDNEYGAKIKAISAGELQLSIMEKSGVEVDFIDFSEINTDAFGVREAIKRKRIKVVKWSISLINGEMGAGVTARLIYDFFTSKRNKRTIFSFPECQMASGIGHINLLSMTRLSEKEHELEIEAYLE